MYIQNLRIQGCSSKIVRSYTTLFTKAAYDMSLVPHTCVYTFKYVYL